MIFKHISLGLIAMLINSCTTNVNQMATASPTTLIVATTTLFPTLTPQPTKSPLSPPAAPTLARVEGITSTQVNVRAEPSTHSE